MPVLARLQPLNEAPDERRRAPRLLLKLGAKVGSGSAAVVHDLSTKGLLFETSEDLGGERIDVHLPETAAAAARIVWSHGRFYGCEFEEPIPRESVSAALLRSEPKPAAAALPFSGAGHREDEAGEATSLRGWISGAIVVALLVAGAAWLILTGKLLALAVIGLGAIAVIALLAALMLRTLDNSIHLKL